VAEVKAATGLPAIADIPPILSEKITNALQGQFTNDFLQGEGVAIVAMNAWAYGYYMPYFFGYENPDPGCGINEFHDVLRNYREFGTFGLTFGSPEHIVQGLFSTTANTLPIFAKYRVQRFVEELRLALHCLVNRSEKQAIDLASSIGVWLEIALLRLDLTSELMGI